MGFFSHRSLNPLKSAYSNPLIGIHDITKRFNKPSTEGLSDAEKRELDRQKAEEDARKQRLQEALDRRSRAALGSRSLLYGSYAGTSVTLGGSSTLGTNTGQGGKGG